MRAHHISSILWELDLIDSHIGAPQFSTPRRHRMLLVFEFARLVPFVAPNVIGFSLANPQSAFRIRKVKLVPKCQEKKIACGAKIYLCFKIRIHIWCALNFRSKYSRNGHICILICKIYQTCANHAKSVPYFLVLKGKIRGNWPLFSLKVCRTCALFHYWPLDPHENLLIYLL